MNENPNPLPYGFGHDPKSDAHKKRVTGRIGEKAACEYLKSKGWEIVDQNYRHGKHEIDIIAKNYRYIIFTEVKTRSSEKFGAPSQAVNRKKSKSIITAATGYLRRCFFDLYPRFDIIEVISDPENGNVQSITHIEGAFDGKGNPIR